MYGSTKVFSLESFPLYGSFFDVSDSLTIFTARHDTYISRFADFLWTTTDGQTDHFTPCACVWGKHVYSMQGPHRENHYKLHVHSRGDLELAAEANLQKDI